MLFSAYVIELNPPCGLHLILAHHRYIWRFMYNVAKARNMQHLLAEGLRKIGCSYLGYQLDRYEDRWVFCYYKWDTYDMNILSLHVMSVNL